MSILNNSSPNYIDWINNDMKNMTSSELSKLYKYIRTHIVADIPEEKHPPNMQVELHLRKQVERIMNDGGCCPYCGSTKE